MAAVGFPVPAYQPRDLRGRRWKALTAACLGLASVALVFLPSLGEAFWVALRSGAFFQIGVAAFVGLVGEVAEGVAVLETLSGVIRAVAGEFASPLVLAALAASAAVSLAAFRLLQGLMVSQEGGHHA
jgi:hypothetical protein